MMKATVAFLLIYMLNIVLGGVFEGAGGMAATRLLTAIDSTERTLTVANTNGFLASDYVVIGGERIRYTSKTSSTFTVPLTNGRGYSNTTAVPHVVGSNVYSESTDTLNSIVGFNIASTGATIGTMNIATMLWGFLFTTLPKLLTWNFPHLMVNEWTQYLRYIGVLITTGYVFWVILSISSSLGGVLQSVFLRR